MPLFAYKALASNGSVTTGEIDATDRPEALRMLDRKGLQPVNLKETASAVQTRKPAGKAKADEAARAAGKPDVKEDAIPEGPIKLKRAEVVLFTEELSDMLSAGCSLSRPSSRWKTARNSATSRPSPSKSARSCAMA
jgi:general secretion pathway protein F